jgi:hypothetical protein
MPLPQEKISTSSEGRIYSGKKFILYLGVAFQPRSLTADFSRLESRSHQKNMAATQTNFQF